MSTLRGYQAATQAAKNQIPKSPVMAAIQDTEIQVSQVSQNSPTMIIQDEGSKAESYESRDSDIIPIAKCLRIRRGTNATFDELASTDTNESASGSVNGADEDFVTPNDEHVHDDNENPMDVDVADTESDEAADGTTDTDTGMISCPANPHIPIEYPKCLSKPTDMDDFDWPASTFQKYIRRH